MDNLMIPTVPNFMTETLVRIQETNQNVKIMKALTRAQIPNISLINISQFDSEIDMSI